MKRITAILAALLLLFAVATYANPIEARGPPDLQRRIFVHFAKPDNPGKGGGGEDDASTSSSEGA